MRGEPPSATSLGMMTLAQAHKGQRVCDSLGPLTSKEMQMRLKGDAGDLRAGIIKSCSGVNAVR